MIKNNLVGQFIALGNQLSEESTVAHDLWTWLPSYKVAEKYHKDYASEFAPSVKDIMVEATVYFAHLKHPERPLDIGEKDWFESCPCGEPHSGE